MPKNQAVAPATSTAVIVHRKIAFLKPEASTKSTGIVDSGDPNMWFVLNPTQMPQPIPDWIRETDTYQRALAAHYIHEVGMVGPITKPLLAPIPLDRNDRSNDFPPLAAETRRLDHYNPKSGLGQADEMITGWPV